VIVEREVSCHSRPTMALTRGIGRLRESLSLAAFNRALPYRISSDEIKARLCR
jgi:hypothetical protein